MIDIQFEDLVERCRTLGSDEPQRTGLAQRRSAYSDSGGEGRGMESTNR